MTTVKYQTVGGTSIGISLSAGFTVFVLVYSIGHISGGHLNFTVTFTFWLLKKMSGTKCLMYFFAQLIGGLIGIGFLKLVTPVPWWTSCFAANFIHPDLTIAHGLLVEFILAFFFMFVVMAACDSSKSNQTLVPFVIGMTIFCCHMIGLPITGCSINPTRSFASAVAATGLEYCDAWDAHWIFWFAPLVGGSSAGFCYDYFFHEGGHKIDRLIDMYLSRPQTTNTFHLR